MCLSKVYFDSDDNRELLMEEVASLKIEDGKLMIRTFFGEQKEIEATIRQIDFMTHSILLESLRGWSK